MNIYTFFFEHGVRTYAVVRQELKFFFIYLKIYNGNLFRIFNFNIYHTDDYFGYFCAVKFKNYIDMEKLFNFIRSLKPSFYEVCGYPTIKVFSDYSEVYFDVTSTIRDLEVFDISCDEFRMFPGNGCITVVFTFYNLPFEDE